MKAAPSAQRLAPDLTGKAVQAARKLLINQGIDCKTVGGGSTVVSQYPEAGTLLAAGKRIYLLSQQVDQVSIPNLRGQSLRDALEVLNLLKVKISVEGEGYITEQTESTQNGKRLVELNLEPLNTYGEDIPVSTVEEAANTENREISRLLSWGSK